MPKRLIAILAALLLTLALSPTGATAETVVDDKFEEGQVYDYDYPADEPSTGGIQPLETCVAGFCQGGDIHHYSPDGGYDPAIIVFCNYGAPWSKRKYVAEGTGSTQDCGNDTDQVYIRAGEELWCGFVYSGQVMWEKVFDATGRHKINDMWSRWCTLRKD